MCEQVNRLTYTQAIETIGDDINYPSHDLLKHLWKAVYGETLEIMPDDWEGGE